MTRNNTEIPIIDGAIQRRIEAAAAVHEPRTPPSVTEAEAVAEKRFDLVEMVMQELPNDTDPKRFAPGRPRSGPVVT